jgi:hypothetical protein
MKRTFLFLFCVIAVLFGYSQAPQSFKYQAVIRDASNQVLANQNVALRISIIETMPAGTAVYVETHNATTTEHGLVTISLGEGTVQSGVFAGISWGTNAHFVKIEVDPLGGTSYVDMGTTQLLSVPYALYAASSGGGGTGLPSGNQGSTMRYSGANWISNDFLVNKGNRLWVNVDSTTTTPSLYSSATVFIVNDNDAMLTNTSDDSHIALHLATTTQVNGEGVGIAFSNSGEQNLVGAKIVHQRTAGWSVGDLCFFTKSGVGGGDKTTEKMRITSLGNVGIGTNPISYRFHVNHSALTNRVSLFEMINNNGIGADYTYNSSISSVIGYVPASLRGSPSVDAWQFGVVGQKGQNYAGANYYDYRSGGVLGTLYREDNTTMLAWGALGYKNSSSANFGGYFSSTTTGTGFNSSGSELSGVAIGGYGSMLGAWTKGEVMGHISSGELFSAYNIGNTYTSGTHIEMVNIGSEKVPAYSVTSRQMSVYDRGFATIQGTSVFVPFEKEFAVLLNNERPVVTITPMGQPGHLYIESITKDGFTVSCTSSQNMEFSWIAVGTRVDSEQNAQIPDNLRDPQFDKNLQDFMFDENLKERKANAMWWDGYKLQFGEMPERK